MASVKRLTSRGRALHWLTLHRGITEDPPGSNTDSRRDGIRAAAQRLGWPKGGVPWCGIWFANGLLAAGVKGVNQRQASVGYIEDDAKAHHAPFRGWVTPADKGWRGKVLRGDGVVLFGYGVHVETVRGIYGLGRLTWVLTDGGNTSSGSSGSQDNGGGAFRRHRPISAVRGFALVDYPNS